MSDSQITHHPMDSFCGESIVTPSLLSADRKMNKERNTKNQKIESIEPMILMSASGADINGTESGDILIGFGPGDTVNGLGGDDTLIGLGGSNVLNGGDGND